MSPKSKRKKHPTGSVTRSRLVRLDRAREAQLVWAALVGISLGVIALYHLAGPRPPTAAVADPTRTPASGLLGRTTSPSPGG